MDTPYPNHEGRLVGLSGQAGSGKSALAKELMSYGWVSVKFADPLKAMLATFYEAHGLTPAEIEDRLDGHLKEEPDPLLLGATPRWAMQTLGTEWGRNSIHSALWESLWRKRVVALLRAGHNVVADDLRFPNELAALVALGGTSISVHRPDNRARATSSHVSEALPFECDETIINDGNLTDLTDSLWAILD